MRDEELVARLKKGNCPCIVDVRSQLEFSSGHIPGALHVPFWGALLKRGSLPQNKQAEIVLTCEHGPRAQVAAGQLSLLGYSNVTLLQGHMSNWRRKGLPLEK